MNPLNTLSDRVGYVAETCPVCHSVQVVQVFRISTTDPFQTGKVRSDQFLGAVGRCTTCHHEFPAELTDYPMLCQRADWEMPEIVRMTNPKLGSNPEAETAFARFAAVRRPFLDHGQGLNEMVCTETRMDGASLWSLFLALPIPALLTWVVTRFPQTHGVRAVAFAAVAFAVGIGSFVFIFFTQHQRHFRNEILPKIVRDLLPLEVSESELQTCFERFATYGYGICRLASVRSITAALNRARDEGLARR